MAASKGKQEDATNQNEEAPQYSPTDTAEMLDLVLTEAMGMAMHNAVSAQQNAQIMSSALISAACKRILSTNQNEASVSKPTGTTTAANKKKAASRK